MGKKNMFFVIPEMPSKTFVMDKKNFLITLRCRESRDIGYQFSLSTMVLILDGISEHVAHALKEERSSLSRDRQKLEGKDAEGESAVRSLRVKVYDK